MCDMLTSHCPSGNPPNAGLHGANGKAAARDLGSTARIMRYKIDNLGIDWKRYRRRKG